MTLKIIAALMLVWFAAVLSGHTGHGAVHILPLAAVALLVDFIVGSRPCTRRAERSVL
jgi:hypothetical protein